MSKGDGRQATIFLVEEDDETRPLLKENLQRDGYRVLLAVDEEDALERVGGGHVHADLVLVNLVGKTTDQSLTVGRGIRAHAEFDGATPLVVMVEKYGADVEGTDVNVADNDWLTYLEEPYQLRDLLARLLDKTPA
jgi:DNA-binding response OmpR family regulator